MLENEMPKLLHVFIGLIKCHAVCSCHRYSGVSGCACEWMSLCVFIYFNIVSHKKYFMFVEMELQTNLF